MSKIFAFLLLVVPFLGEAGTNDGSILLLNDSAFILTATIQASDGTFLGQFTIQPGQQRNFTTHLNPTAYVHPGSPRTSLTPYMVIWQCPSEGTYSMCPAVSPGALCKANDCRAAIFVVRNRKSKKSRLPRPSKRRNST